MAAGDSFDIRRRHHQYARTKESPAHQRIGGGTPNQHSSASTSVVSAMWLLTRQLGCAQIFGGRFTPTVRDDIERHCLTLVKRGHAGTFNGADMDEDISPTIRWLNKSKAFLAVEPLHSSLIHRVVLSDSMHVELDARIVRRQSQFIDFGEESETCAPSVTRRSGPVIRPSIEKIL